MNASSRNKQPRVEPRASRFLESRLARFALAILSGALVAFTFPDFNANLLAFVALAPLIAACVFASGTGEAFLLATVASTTTWMINLPWIINVMSHYGGLDYALGVLIFIAAALLLGVIAGLIFGIAVYHLRLRETSWRWLLVPVAWMMAEYGRKFLFTGFPWDPIAVGIINLQSFVQLAQFTGTYILGCLVLIPSTAFAWAIVTRDRGRYVRVFTAVAVALVAWAAIGAWLHHREEALIASEAKSTAALIQPDISQEMRWSEANLSEIFQRMMTMTESGITKGADVVIWPESSVPLTYATTSIFRDYVESTSRAGNVDVILGSVAEDEKDPVKIWNAAYLVSDGRTVGRYDKIKLVPFGEYVPFRRLLFFAAKLVRQVGTFQFGSNDRPLQGKFAYGPAICYEVAHPQITATQTRHGANVLVTITNDAWFGHSAAPTQHLANARLRAIEDNRYLLRAATTGISAVIDPTGRVVESLPLDAEGIIMARFAPRQSRTPYVRFGDWMSVPLIAVLVATLVMTELKRRKETAQRA